MMAEMSSAGKSFCVARIRPTLTSDLQAHFAAIQKTRVCVNSGAGGTHAVGTELTWAKAWPPTPLKMNDYLTEACYKW